MTLTVSLGYPAYNEEKNIANLLDHLLAQELPEDVKLEEIIIVASGCTDNTISIIREYQQRNPVIKLIVEGERKGHASAVNLILESAKGEILIIGCADTQPTPDAIACLIEPIREDPTIGAVVGRAVPINNPNTLWGYIAQRSFQWNYLPQFLMIDFEGHTAMRRRLLEIMPQHAIYTERLADAMVRTKGYKVMHASEAVTYIKEPDNLTDFINQKRRNIYMHLQQKKENIPAPHIELGKVIPIAFRSLEPNPKKLFWLGAMLTIWSFSYILGWLDVKMGRSQAKWKVVTSAKSLTNP